MKLLVLDASVAAKWFLPSSGETLSEEALALVERSTSGEVRFIVPDLFWAEFGNVLWKAVRQRRLTRASAEAAIRSMGAQGLPTVPSADLLESAFAIAAEFERSVYDSMYVALAISRQAELVTADERLANALAARLPVKWLGAI